METRFLNKDGLLPTEIKVKQGGGLEIRTFQDLDPVLNANQRKRTNSDFDDGYAPSKDMKHVASIPLILITQWAREHGVSPFGPEMNEIIRKKLNCSEYAYLRTGGGRI